MQSQDYETVIKLFKEELEQLDRYSKSGSVSLDQYHTIYSQLYGMVYRFGTAFLGEDPKFDLKRFVKNILGDSGAIKMPPQKDN